MQSPSERLPIAGSLLDHNVLDVDVDFGLLPRVEWHVVEAEAFEGLHVTLRLVQLPLGHILGSKHAVDGGQVLQVSLPVLLGLLLLPRG